MIKTGLQPIKAFLGKAVQRLQADIIFFKPTPLEHRIYIRLFELDQTLLHMPQSCLSLHGELPVGCHKEAPRLALHPGELL